MAIPSYMAERRYTYHVSSVRTASTGNYVVETPETVFEQDVYDLFLEAEQHLHDEEYGLALAAFEELQLLILNTVHPEMPVDPYVVNGHVLVDADLVEPIAEHAATMLKALSSVEYEFPRSMVASESKLPVALQKQLAPATDRGLLVTSFHKDVLTALGQAADAAAAGDHGAALEHYERALGSVPAGDELIAGAMRHDMALLADKAGDHARAAELGTQSLGLMEKAGDVGRPRARARRDGGRLRARGPEGPRPPERRPRRPAARGAQPRPDRRGARHRARSCSRPSTSPARRSRRPTSSRTCRSGSPSTSTAARPAAAAARRSRARATSPSSWGSRRAGRR